ncbi:MAG: VanZ family protein [Lachnospira sp.]|nr:VanZ family protein [Lachnospira sp.]
MKSKLTNLLIIALGILCGYLFYYFILMDIIDSFCNLSSTMYIITSLFALALCLIAFPFLLWVIIKKRVTRLWFRIVTILYFCLLILVFWGRPSYERVFSLNLIAALADCIQSREMLLQMILNLAVLFPLGYLFRFKSIPYKKSILCFLGISFIIEIVQYITKRGSFDIFDIILYITGMTLGYFVFSNLKLEVGDKR